MHDFAPRPIFAFPQGDRPPLRLACIVAASAEMSPVSWGGVDPIVSIESVATGPGELGKGLALQEAPWRSR